MITGMSTDRAAGMTMSDDRPFDWHYSPLDRATVIDATYRNTQNVRRFFKAEIGQHFGFDRAFMAWMKANRGKSLGDAVAEWQSRNGHA